MDERQLTGLPIAGFWRRLAALAVDFIIWSVVESIALLAHLGPVRHASALSVLLEYLSWIIAILAYLVVGQAIWGRTLGKWFLRLRVVGPGGRPPGWKRALIRNLVLSAPSLLYLLLTIGVVATGLFITDPFVANAVSATFTLLFLALFVNVAFTASRGRPGIHDSLAGTRVTLLPARHELEAADLTPSG
jgi:uncharacterized RDD family membrane protein YckC